MSCAGRRRRADFGWTMLGPGRQWRFYTANVCSKAVRRDELHAFSAAPPSQTRSHSFPPQGRSSPHMRPKNTLCPGVRPLCATGRGRLASKYVQRAQRRPPGAASQVPGEVSSLFRDPRARPLHQVSGVEETPPPAKSPSSPGLAAVGTSRLLLRNESLAGHRPTLPEGGQAARLRTISRTYLSAPTSQ